MHHLKVLDWRLCHPPTKVQDKGLGFYGTKRKRLWQDQKLLRDASYKTLPSFHWGLLLCKTKRSFAWPSRYFASRVSDSYGEISMFSFFLLFLPLLYLHTLVGIPVVFHLLLVYASISSFCEALWTLECWDPIQTKGQSFTLVPSILYFPISTYIQHSTKFFPYRQFLIPTAPLLVRMSSMRVDTEGGPQKVRSHFSQDNFLRQECPRLIWIDKVDGASDGIVAGLTFSLLLCCQDMMYLPRRQMFNVKLVLRIEFVEAIAIPTDTTCYPCVQCCRSRVNNE